MSRGASTGMGPHMETILHLLSCSGSIVAVVVVVLVMLIISGGTENLAVLLQLVFFMNFLCSL